ncbi:MAG: retropepsin-like aspartic protease [Rhodocyclaceae bacterium]|nr:retropepsin-like aspartic protease [Rhodocyclaceae bacterium]
MSESPESRNGDHRVRLAEPVEAMPTSAQEAWGDRQAAERQLSLKFKGLLAIVGVVGLVAGLVFITTPDKKAEGEMVDLSDKNAPFMTAKTQARVSQADNQVAPKCDEEFTVGSYTVLRDVKDGVPLMIRNSHTFRIMLKLYNEGDTSQFFMVGLEPKSDEEIVLPIGKFRMEAFSGNEWCNPDLGFTDGIRVEMKGAITIKADKNTKLEFVSEGPKAGDILPRLFETASAPKQEADATNPKGSKSQPENGRSAKGKGKPGDEVAKIPECVPPPVERPPPPYEITEGEGANVRLRPLAGGNYFVTGMANNFPVVYVVDTGAPTVVLPQTVAARAGVRSCIQKTIQTHKGYIKGCFANINELEFGKFRVRNVEAMILQGPTGDAVLGMTLLQRFRVEQINGVIQIGRAAQ